MKKDELKWTIMKSLLIERINRPSMGSRVILRVESEQIEEPWISLQKSEY